ncbi:MAG: tRNA (cytidine(34)-2'-O)-methyltransferase [Candidatus Marinimicrobia bacterium]|nr:tRNA (cytidine(34)-2'-O)-methyltransferase [Candidatus Neomarinimicrobiota bacterium]MBT7084070.1 tRNA (cytidine(34)-2'-O)-methyltransferase [Candidatus Neomarinimicrobiota bacterium]MBT7922520.1 tRNA (cytidine(34)-2'-O)-methyltransferase [Candidatus Neomarinimicrobiota bacterium]
MFHIILFEPEIPPNTGNIIRLSANTGFEVHLIEPLGFKVDDKSLKRAGMDYLKKTDFQVWISLDECLNTLDPQNIYTVSTKGKSIYSDLTYSQGDAFIFGPESRGLPQTIIDKYESITIPMKSTGRSINLANAVSIVAYEAWRQNAFK